MKKSLLIATSALVGLTAVAITPVNEVLTKADGLKESSKVYKNNVAMKAEKAVVDAARRNVVAKSVSNGNYTFYPVMKMPVVPFYMSGLTSTNLETGAVNYVAPVVVPVNTPVTYNAGLYALKANANVPDVDKSSIKYSWKYLDFNDLVEKNASGSSLTMNYPASLTIGPMKMPQLTFSYGEVSDSTKDVQDNYRLLLGGSGVYPFSDGVSTVGFNTIPMINNMSYQPEGAQWSGTQECKWGTMKYNNLGTTFTETAIGYMFDDLASDFKTATGEDLKTIDVKGFGYNMPYPGSPYLLSNLTLYAWANITAETTFNVDVYEADADGNMVGEPLYKKTCTVVPTENTQEGYSYRTTISADFTSKDEDGFDLNYVVVDKPLFVLVSGFLNNPSVTSFAPWAGGYASAEINNKTGARNNFYGYGRAVENTACNVIDLIGANGKKISNLQNYFNIHIWGSADDTSDWTTYYLYKNFFVNVVAEFPYLQPEKVIVGNSQSTDVKYEADGNYTIDVPTGTESLAIDIATSSTDADEIVIDDDALVAGVEMKVADGLELVNQGYTYNFIELQFTLDKNFVDKSFTIPVMYKNQKINLTIKNGSASVNEIVVDANATTQYYDLQGRKVTGSPEKGIYIVKEGNKARKVVL